MNDTLDILSDLINIFDVVGEGKVEEKENVLFEKNGFSIQNINDKCISAVTMRTDYPIYVMIQKQPKKLPSCVNNIKEQKILNYLTKSHRQPCINPFTPYFESDEYFYTVSELKPLTLQQFTAQSFEYINQRNLQFEEYNQVNKEILFQLSTAVNWLHNDINCSHFSLDRKKIYLHNLEFIHDSTLRTWSICISNDFMVKLADFSKAHIFQNSDKVALDARASDLMKLGMTFFESISGISIGSNEEIGWAIKSGKIAKYIEMNYLVEYFHPKSLKVIHQLLQENQRFTAKDLVCCEWFFK